MDLDQFRLTNLRGFGSQIEEKICDSPQFLWCSGIFGWKRILKFLIIPFLLLIYFG